MKTKKKLRQYSSLIIVGIILCIAACTKAAITYPRPTQYKYLNDYANVVDRNSARQIIALGRELEEKTGAQLSVVTIDTLDNEPIEDYANGLFRTWGIGQANQDNGLLILLVVKDHEWRVEVGRGLEGAIPDALSNRVMQELGMEAFSKGAYGQGLAQVSSQFGDLIAKEYDVTLTHSLNTSIVNGYGQTSGKRRSFAIYLWIIGIILVDIIFNRGRILNLLLWSSFFSGGGHRRGGGGGGYGGFGGGSSNGGGSSGSW